MHHWLLNFNFSRGAWVSKAGGSRLAQQAPQAGQGNCLKNTVAIPAGARGTLRRGLGQNQE